MSHHLSGPRAMAESAADVTDLFAFPSPERPGRLVLALNTHPFASPSALFSDGLIYRFRLRPLTANSPENPVPFTADGDEIVIDWVFSAPGTGDGANSPEQEGTCQLPDGRTISARVNDERGGQADGVRIFAGLRWDPFFEDFPAEQKTIATGKLAFTAHPLTGLILADYLVVDVAKPYAERDSFLEIELAARRGEDHRTCGGRAPNDDVMDTLFTLMVNGGNGPVIRDGVDQPTMLASRQFPYLAAPNPDPPELPHA